PIDRGAQRGTDGGLVGVDGADKKAVELLVEEIMIQRRRRGDVGIAGEYDEADAIVWSFLHETFENGACHFETVGAAAVHFEIFGHHTAGEVEGSDDIDAAGFDLGFAAGEPRLSEGDDEERQRKPAQGREERTGPRA